MTRSQRALVVLVLALVACRRSGPATEQSAAVSASASAASASEAGLSPSSSTSAAATLGKPGTRAEDTSAALDASVMERLVFREILVGGYTGNWRRTWILYRSEKRARLDVLCQNGVEMIRLRGKENDESAWTEPVLMHYAGAREGEGAYRLALTSGTAGKLECAWMPETFILSCRPEPVAVLRSGAALILDDASQGLFHWSPSGSESVAGLRCEGVTNERFQWPLVFVAQRNRAPGIEWAFQHDDVVQQGAYRWTPMLAASSALPVQTAPTVLPPATGTAAAQVPPSTRIPLADMVEIKGGSFWMGSRDEDKLAYDSERPRHRVTVDGFLMGRTEVTQAQYREVLHDSPGTPKGDDLPVNNVSWVQAVKFCNALSDREGHARAYGDDNTWNKSADGYRLPTEAEWEYAARAGTETQWSFGDKEAKLGDYAWFNENSGDAVHPVAQKKPNPWGLYDMHGNVLEWCWDWYGSYPAPPASGSERVSRGGAAGFAPRMLRSAMRVSSPPEIPHQYSGLRVVRGSLRQP